jgi:hypothetical protein
LTWPTRGQIALLGTGTQDSIDDVIDIDAETE